MTIMGGIGRALGATSGAVTSLIWVYMIWFPTGLTEPGATVVVAGFMGLLAIVGAIAAVKGHSTVLFIVFIASFLPIGARVLYLDHWLRAVGALNLLLLVAVIMIRFGKRKPRA